jgi:hypothetical protein
MRHSKLQAGFGQVFYDKLVDMKKTIDVRASQIEAEASR